MDMKLTLPFVTPRYNKNSTIRYYFTRRNHPVKRLPDEFKSAGFMDAYNLLVNQEEVTTLSDQGSFAWACDEYRLSMQFTRLGQSTQRAYVLIMRSMQDELVNPTQKQTFGQTRIKSFTRKHIEVLRDRKRTVPNTANKRLKVLNAVFMHALRNDFIDHSPNTAIEKISVQSDGHKTATDAHLQQYMQHHPQGPAILAIRLLKATGARVSDLRLLGLPNLNGSIISFKTVKTNMLVEIDIGDALANELRSTNRFIFLHSHIGKPFKSDKSMSAAISKWFKQANIENITAHSVRKWLATHMADQGVDEFGLMAFFGWRDAKESKPYTQAYNRKKAAQKAFDKITNV